MFMKVFMSVMQSYLLNNSHNIKENWDWNIGLAPIPYALHDDDHNDLTLFMVYY